MAQPGTPDGIALPSRFESHTLRRSIQVGVLAVIGALGSHPAAHAANCVYTSSRLASSTLAPDGVLLVKTHCSGELPDCAKAPALEVTLGGAQVQGAVEIVYQTRSELWVAFRPNMRWQVGKYILSKLPRSWEMQTETFEVTSTPASFSFDAALVKLNLAAGLEPAGERICCPSHGEGSCDLDCGGADGERHVAVVRATFPQAPTSVVWRIVDAEAKDGKATFDGAFTFASARERYCVKVSAWDTYNDTTHAFERCLDANGTELGEVGRVDASWSALPLETCSAPPIVGGYGFDVWGVPDANALPEVDEPLRKAFCAAQRASCSLPAQNDPDGGFESWCTHTPYECPCIYALHYCPEFATKPTASAQKPDASALDAGPDASLRTAEPTEPDEDADESATGRTKAEAGAPETDTTTSSRKPKAGCSLALGVEHASSPVWAMLALVWFLRRCRGRALRPQRGSPWSPAARTSRAT